MLYRLLSALCLIGMLGLSTKAFAEVRTFTIVIKNHRFEPAELEVPANEKIQLVIKNEDETEEEFESYDLNREEIVNGGEEITVFIDPLDPGEYSYFGEFNPETAQGIIKAIRNGEGK